MILHFEILHIQFDGKLMLTVFMCMWLAVFQYPERLLKNTHTYSLTHLAEGQKDKFSCRKA